MNEYNTLSLPHILTNIEKRFLFYSWDFFCTSGDMYVWCGSGDVGVTLSLKAIYLCGVMVWYGGRHQHAMWFGFYRSVDGGKCRYTHHSSSLTLPETFRQMNSYNT